MNLKEIGRRIRHYRLLRGLTQEELAKKIGVSWEMVSRYENGRSDPTNRIVFIANALNTSPNILLGLQVLKEDIKSYGHIDSGIALLDINELSIAKEQLQSRMRKSNVYLKWRELPFEKAEVFAMQLDRNKVNIINELGIVWKNKTYGLFQLISSFAGDSDAVYLYTRAIDKRLVLGKVSSLTKVNEILARLWKIVILF